MTKHGDSQTKKTLHELAKEFPDKTYRELEKYREKDRQQEAGICIMGEMRKDREEIFEPGLEEQIEVLKKELDLERECSQAGYLENKKLIKRVQEAEGELSIVKTITIDSSPEMRDAKKEIKNLKWIKDQDYIFLVDENKRLHAELKKLKEDTRVNRARKAGL